MVRNVALFSNLVKKPFWETKYENTGLTISLKLETEKMEYLKEKVIFTWRVSASTCAYLMKNYFAIETI